MHLPQAVPRPRGARTPACRVGTLADARRAVTPPARCRIWTRIPDGPNFSTGEMQTAARRIKAPSDSYRYGAITVRPWTARLTANKVELPAYLLQPALLPRNPRRFGAIRRTQLADGFRQVVSNRPLR